MKNILLLVLLLGGSYAGEYELIPKVTKEVYTPSSISKEIKNDTIFPEKEIPVQYHQPMPEKIQGIYLSSWASGTASFRERANELIATGAINTLVIDVKDSTGKLSFIPKNKELLAQGNYENRIADIDEYIKELHKKNIYVVGRVATFEDNTLSRKKPALALQKKDGTTWVNSHGLGWLDPGSEEVWRYVLLIGEEAYGRGFDEINFDYVRFPSDGKTKEYSRPISKNDLLPQTLGKFFSYVDTHKKFPISFDIFGMTTTAADDMGIGQLYEEIIPHGDGVYLMTYPSHYSSGVFGFKNPAEHPYEVISQAVTSAVTRAENKGIDTRKLRIWVQDFNLGATYDKAKVLDQIHASTKAGIDSWVLWDPRNKYTKDALLEIGNTSQSNTSRD